VQSSLTAEVELRSLRADDTERLSAYFAGLSAATLSRYQPHPLTEAMAVQLCATPDDATHRLVLTHADAIIGYFVMEMTVRGSDRDRYAGYGITLEDGLDLLFAPSVADAWQNRGLASLAMPPVIALATATGARSLVLMGGTQASNARAIRFYEKSGFMRHGGYQTDQWNHDMRLLLEGAPTAGQGISSC
jgi:diamine N-acetyltransferase